MPIDAAESKSAGLTSQQLVRLAVETSAATNLIRDGTSTLRSMTSVMRGADSVWTLLSLGTEKMLKLSVGLVRLEDSGKWPGKEIRKFSHGLVELEEVTRQAMRDRVQLSAQPGYSERALAALEADRVWPLLLVGLDRYGQGGRYHWLDWVSEEPDFESPEAYWRVMEQEVTAQQPDLLGLFISTAPDDLDEARRRTNAVVNASIMLWWEAVHTFWSQGAFGEVARSLSSDINPHGALAC